MGLLYVGSNSGAGAASNYAISLTALTGGIDTAARTGDIVIAVSGICDTADLNPGIASPVDFTELADLYSDDSRDANFSVSYKIMTASPDTSITATSSGSSANGGSTVVHVWRGVNQTTPIDVTTTTATGINGALATPPAIVPTTPGAIILVCSVGTDDSTPLTQTAPSGYGNALSVAGTGSTRNSVTNIASKNWSLGVETPAAWTGGETTTSDAWCAATIALRPAKPSTRLNNYQFVSVGDGMSSSEKIK